MRSPQHSGRPPPARYSAQVRGGVWQVPERRAPRGSQGFHQLHGGRYLVRQCAHHHHLRVGAGGASGGGQGVGLQHGARCIQRLLAPGAVQRGAGGQHQGGQGGVPGQAQRAGQQALVCSADDAALQLHAGQLQVLQHAACRKGLAGMGQAQGGYISGHAFGAGRQLQGEVVFGLAGAVAQALQRQPFQPGAFGHGKLRALHCTALHCTALHCRAVAPCNTDSGSV